MKKRVFALLLAMAMALCAAGAMAEISLVGIQRTLKAGETYTLTGDEGYGAVIYVQAGEQPAKLVLGEHTLTCDMIYIFEGASLELYATGDGAVIGKTYGILIAKGGSLTMYGGAVSGETYGISVGSGSSGEKPGTFVMNGGVVSGKCGVIVGEDNSFTMNGGTVSAMDNSDPGVINNGTFTMHGGTVTGKAGVTNLGTFTMHGGTASGASAGLINNWADAASVISAGTLTGKQAVKIEKGTVSLAKGSKITRGGFDQTEAIVEKLPAASGDLPETGDASMLGAWVLMLGASAAGLRRRRR